MKKLLILLLIVISVSAQATLRCETDLDGARIKVEVDRPLPNQRFVNARAYLVLPNDTEYLDFGSVRIDPFSRRFHEFRVDSIGFEVKVDHWPDRFPVVGKTYMGEVTVDEWELDREDMWCRFDRFKK